MTQAGISLTTDPSAAPTQAEMDDMIDRHHAAAFLDKLCGLVSTGPICRELAVDFLIGKLRLAHDLGEIDGGSFRDHRLLEMRRVM